MRWPVADLNQLDNVGVDQCLVLQNLTLRSFGDLSHKLFSFASQILAFYFAAPVYLEVSH